MNDIIEKKGIDTQKIDYTIDFITTSAISKIGYKFLALYIPILWISGYITVAVFFDGDKYPSITIPLYANIN